MRTFLRKIIWLYQAAVSPFTSPRCRFYPSCSHYAAQALELHGATRGSWLTLKRMAKCHPFHAGGVDLVPDCQSDAHSDADCLEHSHG